MVNGGFKGGVGALASTEVWNPTTGTWRATTSSAEVRYAFQMVILPSVDPIFSTVLAAGGNSGGGAVAYADVGNNPVNYNALSVAWTPTGSLANIRTNFKMVVF